MFPDDTVLAVRHVAKSYKGRLGAVPVLIDVNFSLRQGEFCALTGTSGSGKTTMMNLIGLLDRPDTGDIELNGTPTATLSEDSAARLRNRFIGFVFQNFHLLPHLTALDNAALPLLYRGVAVGQRKVLAAAALDRVGLGDRLGHRPDELSGGQRQRVAIARALVGNPALLLADEPTGNLDSRSANDIMELFQALNRESNAAILIVTHDPNVAGACPRQVVMRDGRVSRHGAIQ